MKKIYPLFLFLFFVALFSAQAQEQQSPIKPESDVDFNDIEGYKKNVIPSDFETIFSSEDEKTNFKKLRIYLQRQQNTINLIQNELNIFTNPQFNIDAITAKENELDRKLTEAQKNKLKETSIDVYFPKCNIDVYGSQMSSIEKLNEVKDQLKKCKEEELKRLKEYENLNKNLNVIKKNYTLCQEQIDTALAPEYKDQEFRKHISIGFITLLGFLLIVFVAVVFRSQKNIADYFFSDTGLQFITIFVLIIAIILFGILKILEGRELAAILAGISGYILGKSRSGNNNSNSAAKEEPASSSAPSDKPTTT